MSQIPEIVPLDFSERLEKLEQIHIALTKYLDFAIEYMDLQLSITKELVKDKNLIRKIEKFKMDKEELKKEFEERFKKKRIVVPLKHIRNTTLSRETSKLVKRTGLPREIIDDVINKFSYWIDDEIQQRDLRFTDDARQLWLLSCVHALSSVVGKRGRSKDE